MTGVDTESLKVQDLYRVLGSIPYYQESIDRKWFRYHHTASRMYLYDITSTYFEGTQNVLSSFGDRDRKSGKKQKRVLYPKDTLYLLEDPVVPAKTPFTLNVMGILLVAAIRLESPSR
ncbi:MAG: hypothetical protein LBG15_15315 [Dysgonamonadaceae bacterium]|jgi:hypothetical protein|nr:hypothetical protein [Dysgonamonadaceae bacterium]